MPITILSLLPALRPHTFPLPFTLPLLLAGLGDGGGDGGIVCELCCSFTLPWLWAGPGDGGIVGGVGPTSFATFASSSMIVWPLTSTVSLSLEIVCPLVDGEHLIDVGCHLQQWLGLGCRLLQSGVGINHCLDPWTGRCMLLHSGVGIKHCLDPWTGHCNCPFNNACDQLMSQSSMTSTHKFVHNAACACACVYVCVLMMNQGCAYVSA